MKNRKNTPARKPLPTANEDWGFYGTAARAGHADPAALYEDAGAALLRRFPDATPEAVRAYLDAPYGRHLADRLPAPGFGSVRARTEAAIRAFRPARGTVAEAAEEAGVA